MGIGNSETHWSGQQAGNSGKSQDCGLASEIFRTGQMPGNSDGISM